MKNKAFTVAETLMVTSIIGVLAAIMLGQMSKLTPDKRKIMYKKAYQTIEKTIGELVNDEDLYPYTGDPETYGFKNTITVIYPPGSNNPHGGGTKICTLFERKLNVTDRSTSECGWFTTADGISYNVDKINDNKIKIHIDTNGNGNAPDCQSCATGVEQDRFTIEVETDGRITIPDELGKSLLKSNELKKQN